MQLNTLPVSPLSFLHFRVWWEKSMAASECRGKWTQPSLRWSWMQLWRQGWTHTSWRSGTAGMKTQCHPHTTSNPKPKCSRTTRTQWVHPDFKSGYQNTIFPLHHFSLRSKNQNKYSVQQLPMAFVWTVFLLFSVLVRWSWAPQPRQRMTRPGGKSQRRSKGSSERRCCCCRRREPWRASRPRNSSALVSLRSTSLHPCHYLLFTSMLFGFEVVVVSDV